MSEPVSKIEIEDVLSSIRRLVSEESRVEPRRVYTRERSEQSRLVLTPALRVAEPPEPEEDEADDTPEAEAAHEPLAQAEAAKPNPSDEPWSDPRATLFETARRTPTVRTEDVKAMDPAVAPEVPDMDEFETAAGVEIAESAEAFATVEDTEDDFGADALSAAATLVEAGEDAFYAGEDDEDGGAVAHDVENELRVEAMDAADDLDAAGDLDPFEAEQVETLSAKIHALEAAIGRTDDQWEPDDEGVDDYAGTRVETIEWEDHAADKEPIRPVFGRTTAPEDPDEDDDQDLLAEDEAILDEESLRELVAEIVREELQGALGERITRNVRKLVRREIHRALTAQELE